MYLKTLLIAFNYLKTSIRDITTVSILTILPIIFIFLIGTALENVYNPNIKRFKVYYYNEDNGIYGRQIDNALKQDEVTKNIEIVYGNKPDIEDGDYKNFGSAIIMEKNFTESILKYGKAPIKIIRFPGKSIEAEITNKILTVISQRINMFFYAGKFEVNTDDLKQNGELGFAKFNYIKPLKKITSMQYFSSSILVMFMMLTGILGAGNILKEREDNTLMRVIAAPVSEINLLLGKFIGNTFLSFMQFGIIMAVTKYVFKVNWGDSNLTLFLITLSIVFVSVSMGFLLSFLFKTEKMVSGIMSMAILFMSFIGGSFTPIKEKGILNTISYFTVNKWGFEAYQKLMMGEMKNSINTNILVLFAIGSILFMTSLIIFKKRGSIYE